MLTSLNPQPCSELSGSAETLKPKRDPSKKIHIYRAGQVPGWVGDEEQVEAPPAKSKQKGKNRAVLQRARGGAQEGGSQPREFNFLNPGSFTAD